MSAGFQFGPAMPPGSVGGCCGKPTGCRIVSQGCLFKVRKQAWRDEQAALPSCVTCGQPDKNSNHHPDLLGRLDRCHPFLPPSGHENDPSHWDYLNAEGAGS